MHVRGGTLENTGTPFTCVTKSPSRSVERTGICTSNARVIHSPCRGSIVALAAVGRRIGGNGTGDTLVVLSVDGGLSGVATTPAQLGIDARANSGAVEGRATRAS